MPTRATVTSVEALVSFRTNLIVFLSKARPTLEEVSDSVIRTRVWLESDRRVFWENQLRRQNQKLQDAQQAVFSAELSSLREVSAAERMAVHKAKRAVEETEAKLQLVKRWTREFGSQVEPLAKRLEKLEAVLVDDLPEAIAYLGQAVKTLDAYAGIKPASEERGSTEPQRVDASQDAAAQQSRTASEKEKS
jgi:hypothetical protein